MEPGNHYHDLRAHRERVEKRAGVRYHVTAEQRARMDARVSPSQRGYDAAWKRVRRKFLRANPLCVACLSKSPPLLVPATEADHVVALSKGGRRLDTANLQALCKACHARKTVEHDGGFGREPSAPDTPGTPSER
jgi:5-methylcytosine-specific restriction enzyme A